MNAKRLATAAAGVLASVMFICGVLAFFPPEETHSHAAGPHDKMILIPERNQTQLEELIEPVTDVADFVLPDVANAHHPFPKFCGHYPAARPNHNYYYQNSFWDGGYHYDEGRMDHLFGSDYHYVFRCGSSSHHYDDWPQGWW